MPDETPSNPEQPDLSAASPEAVGDGADAASAEDIAAQALAAAQAAIDEIGAASNAGTPPTASAATQVPASGAAAASSAIPDGAKPFDLPAFGDQPMPELPQNISLLSDVNLNVKIELGRTRMLVQDVLKLSEGCVVELDKLAGDPVDVFVNERHVARGEVLVVNDNFCVRISEIIASPTASDPGAAAA